MTMLCLAPSATVKIFEHLVDILVNKSMPSHWLNNLSCDQFAESLNLGIIRTQNSNILMTIAPLLAPVPIYARGENFTTTPPSLTLWTLRTNDMDDNKKVKKSNRCNKQKNNFARAPHFFVHFLPVFARLRRENALFRVYGGRKQATTKFYFSF